jgi:chemotaxis protein MotA
MLVAILYAALVIILYRNSEGMIERIALAMGGNITHGGYIQVLTVFFFSWGQLEIFAFMKSIHFERELFNYEILPSVEHLVIGDKDVNDIRIRVTNYLEQKKGNGHAYHLLNMIKNVCVKFRANKSISESIEILNMQSRTNLLKAESAQSVIRYIAWVIPSMGFIGTVLGISQALEKANESIEVVTSTLGIAFDTTLLALILSVIYMWRIHRLQEESENLHIENEEYVMKNLVNRIDVW